MAFRRAVRKGTHVLIGMTGPSGTGKTYSAILLARGLVGETGRIAFLDAENGRGRIYAELTEYDIDELYPPFTPERYVEIIKAAEKAGYGALIIDSGTHEWNGEGGVREMVDEEAERNKGEGFRNWNKPKNRHRRFVNAMLHTRMHIILCLRGKDKMVQIDDPDGRKDKKGRIKQIVVNQGLSPIQNDEILFEMTVSLFFEDHDNPGVPRVMKCPGSLMGAFPAGKTVSIESGEKIAHWVESGEPVNSEYEQLLIRAREIALNGLDALRDFWKTLDSDQRALLQPHTDSLSSAAKAAEEFSSHQTEHSDTPDPEETSDGLANTQEQSPEDTPDKGPDQNVSEVTHVEIRPVLGPDGSAIDYPKSVEGYYKVLNSQIRFLKGEPLKRLWNKNRSRAADLNEHSAAAAELFAAAKAAVEAKLSEKSDQGALL